MKDNRKLAKYIYKKINEEGSMDNDLPTINELASWITAFQTRKCVGHSEWSERYQRNIWVSDYEEE